MIQSEVSQEEKDKYILTHIYRIQKNGTEEFTGQQWGNRHREQTYRCGEMMRCMEKVTWKLTLPCVKQPMGIWCMAQ